MTEQSEPLEHMRRHLDAEVVDEYVKPDQYELPRLDIANYRGQIVCSRCGRDENGDVWANCAEAKQLIGLTHDIAHALYCVRKEYGEGEVCSTCQEEYRLELEQERQQANIIRDNEGGS